MLTYDVCDAQSVSLRLQLAVLADTVNDAQKELVKALEMYAIKRNSIGKLVGQFMDREGAAHEQEGIYGMAAWCSITCDLKQQFSQDSYVTHIQPLTAGSYKHLISTLATSEDAPTLDPTSEAFELKYVVPKICAVYAAFSKNAEHIEYANVLHARLRNCLLKALHCGWGFNTDSQTPHPIATSIVMRTIGMKGDGWLEAHIDGILDYLSRDSQSPNTFGRLYVLNTIYYSSVAYKTNHHRSIRGAVRDTIAGMMDSSRLTPLRPGSATNIDFYDKYRTRYYRLQPDLLILEALAANKPSDLRLLTVSPGSTLFDDAVTVIAKDELDVDTFENRMSFSTCLDIHNFLRSVDFNSQKRFRTWLAKIETWYVFGVILASDTISIVILSFAIAASMTFNHFLWVSKAQEINGVVQKIIWVLIAKLLEMSIRAATMKWKSRK